MNEVKEILKKHKIESHRIKEKSKGFDNRVFLVYSNKENFCIRIPIKEKNKIIAQAWAFKKWRKLGIPVPKIIVVEREYLIEELIGGNNFEETKLTLPQKERILFELGRHVKKMHTVKTRGFGYLTKPGIGIKKSWRSFIEPDFIGTLKDVEKHNLLPKSLIRKAEGKFKENSCYLDIKSPRLIHADLTPDNVMVKDGKLSGIIDASDAMSGDLYYDLVVAMYSFGEKIFQHFLKSYGKVDENKLKFYLLYYSNWLVAFNGFIHKREKELKIAIKNFKKSLK